MILLLILLFAFLLYMSIFTYSCVKIFKYSCDDKEEDVQDYIILNDEDTN